MAGPDPFTPDPTDFRLFKPQAQKPDLEKDPFVPEQSVKDPDFKAAEPAVIQREEQDFFPEGGSLIPEPKLIQSSLTSGSASQLPEDQGKNTPKENINIKENFLATRDFLAIPSKKSLEGLTMLTDMIPDPESKSTLVNFTLGIPKMTAEIGAEFASSFIHPDTLAFAGGLKGAGLLAETPAGKKAIAEVATRIPESLKRIATYRFGQPQVYKEAAEQTAINIRIGNEVAGSIGDKINAFSQTEQRMIGQYLRGESVAITKEMKAAGDAARAEFTRLGREAVDLGLLDDAVYQANIDTYLPRMYRSKEIANQTPRLGTNKPLRANLDRFKQRQDIPLEVREGMGEIMEAGYPTTKGLLQLNQAIEKAKMFRQVAQTGEIATADTAVASQKGFMQLPKTKSLGDLSEKYVHPEVHNDLMQIIAPPKQGMEKLWRQALGSWKFGKVVLSPSTHMRNMFTNSFWLDISGVNHIQQAKALPRMIKEISSNGKLYQLAKKEGLVGTELIGADIKPFEQVMKGKAATNMWEALSKFSDGAKQLANKAGKLYQAEEQVFKLIKFEDNLRKGMASRAAALDAEQWIFNYNKVPPAIDAIRNSPLGIPFVTYISKAIPQLGKAMLQNPLRVYKYKLFFDAMENVAMKQLGIESKDQLDVVRQKGGRLIPYKRKDGKGQMLDVDFLMPWGELSSAQMNRGIMGVVPEPFRPSGPAYALINAFNNYDPFYKQPIFDPDIDDQDQQVVKMTNYLGKALMPNLTPGIKGVESPFRGGAHFQKLQAAFIGPTFPIDEPLSKTEAILSTGFGLKTGPIDFPVERSKQVKRQKALSEKVKTEYKHLAKKESVTDAERKAAAERIAPKIQRLFKIKPDIELLQQGIKVERKIPMSAEDRQQVDRLKQTIQLRRSDRDKTPNPGLVDTLIKRRQEDE